MVPRGAVRIASASGPGGVVATISFPVSRIGGMSVTYPFNSAS